MLQTKLKVISVLLIISSLFTGCWDAINIEEHNIVTLFILDYENGNYIYYTEIANIMGSSSAGEAKTNLTFSTLRGKGKTFVEAKDDLLRRSDNQIFRRATRVVVFTKRMAENGIEEYLNRMRNNQDYRKSLYLVTTLTSPEQVIKDTPENDASVGDAIENTLKDQEKMGNSFCVSAGNILQVIADKKAGFLLPEINIEEEENTLTGYSVFKDTKYIGLIPVKERKGLVFFLTSDPQFFYEVNYKGKKLQIMTGLTNKKIKPTLEKEKLTFVINLTFEGEIHYMDQLFSIDDQEKEEITQKLEALVKEDIIKTLQVSQKEYRCDYLHFYKYFRAYNQSKFKTVNWEQMYSEAIMDVSIRAAIKGAVSLDIKPE
ncbi:MAG: Ger(x)C family spore germination protein [Clostridiales bacterium]|nr:Ger(x)C family spore germination protein [Clostridiales bacterium]